MQTAKRYKWSGTVALAACFLSALPCCRAQAAGREIHVVAAADLQSALPAIADAYEHATGIKLIVNYGSSATLATPWVATCASSAAQSFGRSWAGA